LRARKIQVTGSRFNTGKKKSESPEGKIEKRVWIKASAEVVFKALTDPKELVRWFCDRASCNPHEGGEFIAHWRTGKSNQKGRAIFTKIAPNTYLEMVWIDDGAGTQIRDPKHTLSYAIRSKAAMTEVLMVDNDDLISDKETFTFLDQGWNSVLLELKDYCERRERSIKLRASSKQQNGLTE
jgi:uncharacterized protein YndB with AHSA1/START domain